MKLLNIRPKSLCRLLVVATVCFTSTAFASQEPTLAITGGTVHPISSESYVGDVLIRDGLILAAGPSLEVPTDAKVLDARGLHVYPGMFDAFGQLGLLEVSSVAATDDQAEMGEYNPHLQATEAIHPASEVLPVARVNGITHAVVSPVSDESSGIPGQAALIHLDGWTIEEMAIDDSVAMVIDWPAIQTRRFDRATFSMVDIPLKEAEEKAKVKIDELRDWLDAARHYSQAMAADSGRTEPNLKLAALSTILNHGKKVVFLVNAKRDIEAVLAFAAEQELNPILAGGQGAWEMAETLAEKGVPVVLGRSQASPAEEDDPYDRPYGNAGVLSEADVSIAFASGAGGGFGPGGVHSVRNLPYESGTSAGYGLSPDEAFKALTLYPATIYGVDDKLGSIDPGKIANVIVTTGDPLELDTTVQHVIVNGQVTSTIDRHLRLYEKYRSRSLPIHKSADEPGSE